MQAREYVGVEYDPSQDAWTARIESGGQVLYEEDYAFDVDAALGREVALLWNGWPAERNFPELSVHQVCARVAERLGRRLNGTSWHTWAHGVGMSPSDFLQVVQGPSI
jgi:hypothetical protein